MVRFPPESFSQCSRHRPPPGSPSNCAPALGDVTFLSPRPLSSRLRGKPLTGNTASERSLPCRLDNQLFATASRFSMGWAASPTRAATCSPISEIQFSPRPPFFSSWRTGTFPRRVQNASLMQIATSSRSVNRSRERDGEFRLATRRQREDLSHPATPIDTRFTQVSAVLQMAALCRGAATGAGGTDSFSWRKTGGKQNGSCKIGRSVTSRKV